MKHSLLRGCALVLFLLLGYGMVGARLAQAALQCDTASMSNLLFGNVDPQSTQTDAIADFNVECRNTGILLTRNATICLSIGNPSGGSTNTRNMPHATSSTNQLSYQLYQDPARSTVWGSQFSSPPGPLQFNISIPPQSTIQVNRKVYGRVFSGQTTEIPGAYSQAYGAVDTRMTINQPLIVGGSAPGSCYNPPLVGSQRNFPFMVSANVIKKCTVAASPLDFGTNPGLLNTTVTADTSLSVQCSNGTAYNVGLDAGQNGGGNINARKMILGAHSVQYQLYRDSARTQVWGNTIGLNTVAATGNGNTQNLTVYGNVLPQTTPPAGTYTDTVIVTVTY